MDHDVDYLPFSKALEISEDDGQSSMKSSSDDSAKATDNPDNDDWYDETTDKENNDDWNDYDPDDWNDFAVHDWGDHTGIFEHSYLCYPLSHIQRYDLEGGNKIVMPRSALDRLASLKIEYPMMFEIKSHFYAEPIWHCGVLEFTAEEGFVFVPNWMMKNLQLEPGELVKLKSVELPKGKYMKLQPHKTEFMSLKDPKEVLEVALQNFACLTAGETIMISHERKEYFFDVLETEPKNAISVVETDCVVKFSVPLDHEFEEEKRRKEVKEIASEKEIKF